MSDTYPVGVELYSTSSTAVVAAGTAFQCRGRYKVFRIQINDTATVVVQGSAGFDDWHTLTTETSSTTYTNTDPWPYVRVNVSASSSEYGVHMGMSE